VTADAEPDDENDDAEHLSRRYRGRIDGSIVARAVVGEKLFMAAFLGLAGVACALLGFICIAVWDNNRESAALAASFEQYADATNRRLDTLERLVLERRDE
jgi:hypothetical protein